MADKSELVPKLIDAPDWADDMARKYASSALSQFILHGNVLDLVEYTQEGQRRFLPLVDFLTDVFFAQRSLVITYDLSSGIQCPQKEMRAAMLKSVRALDTIRGTDYADRGLPKDPLKAVELIKRVIRGRLASAKPSDKRIAVIVKYAETVFTESEAGGGSVPDRATSIALAELASDPDVLMNDVTLVLITESVLALNKRVQALPSGATIQIPLPDEDTREHYIERVNGRAELGISDELVKVLKKHTSGLTLMQIRSLLQEAKLGNVDFGKPDYIYKRKREMIET
ncbi:hypothetical protein KDL30_11475, partial [bacterium]|nr:hypothetical protein [bacterium]